MNDNKSLAHTTWKCRYHIVFAPKYRRKIFYKEKRAEIGKILRELCGWKGVIIIEAEVCPDCIHILVEIPPKMSVSSFMGFLKGKSSLIIYERHANLKYKHGNRSFWCRGYYVDTVGINTKKIAEYIQKKLEEDRLQDQLAFREYKDPFKGASNKLLQMSGCLCHCNGCQYQRVIPALEKPLAMPADIYYISDFLYISETILPVKSVLLEAIFSYRVRYEERNREQLCFGYQKKPKISSSQSFNFK